MGRPPIEINAGPLKVDPKTNSLGAIRELQKVVTRIVRHRLDRAYRDVKTKTSDYAMDAEADRIILANASGGDITITLPRAEDADYTEYTIVVIAINGSGTDVTFATDGSATINGSASLNADAAYDAITVASDGTNYFRTDINR